MVSGITSDVMSYVKISIGVFKLVGVETETTNNIVPSETETTNNIVPSENESPKPKESIFGKVKNIFSGKNKEDDNQKAINDLKELHKKYNIDPSKLDNSIKQGLKDLHDPNVRETEI